VIVSDMRMPGMDGAELLERVRVAHPEIVRLALSGQSDRQSVFRSIGPTHQFLSKPCDVATLKATIDRIFAARALVQAPAVRMLVGDVDRLPSPPSVYSRLVEAAGAPDCSLRDLAPIVEEDAALTAGVLKLVNSAFFGLHQRIETVETAISLLGLDTITGLILGASSFADDAGVAGWLDLEQARSHSLDVAATSRLLARVHGCPHDVVATAFLAGIVHDIGLLVLGRARLDVPPAELRAFAVDHEPAVIEIGAGAVDRYSVGAGLLGTWGFSHEVVSAVGAQALPVEQCADELALLLAAAHRLVRHESLDPLVGAGHLDEDTAEAWTNAVSAAS
jgi:HD-like signal output (HDOD) protein